MLNTRTILSRLREARRIILASPGLDPTQKIQQFRATLFQQLSTAPEVISGRVSRVVETVDKAIQNSGTSGAHSLASSYLGSGEVSRRAARAACIDVDYASAKILVSKEAASNSPASCIARMYCTFIKEAVEGGTQNQLTPDTKLTSSASESASRSGIQQ
ncbi:hypothetical protein [Neorickettsia findlayensis]|uniref:Uncharacterized protein n=1 Tax=Neorickettsia findlayensis TaxID=2686014 RepID=A0A6P1GB76_9RICK|nr:hypothetical protein [Neorickettsia findlayensis]QHD65414.1 hypothetical protein GP480_03145 [Neorickettsia findlayensis]